jgi:hypothetical protein
VAFCSSCGTQAVAEAAFCGSCGNAIAGGVPHAGSPSGVPKTMSFEKKLHIVLIAAAGLGALLSFTTWYLGFIAACNGAAIALSVRLFLTHKKTNFAGTNKLDWILLMVATGLAMIMQFAEAYDFQGCLLIFASVRSLMMFLKSTSTH